MNSRRLTTLAALTLSLGPLMAAWTAPRELVQSATGVDVELFEKVKPGTELDPTGRAMEQYVEPAFGFVRIPTRYSANALPLDRSTPFVLRAGIKRTFAPGEYEFRLRARGAARLVVDGREIARTAPQKPNLSGNDPVPPPPPKSTGSVRPAAFPLQEQVAPVVLDSSVHEVVLIAVIGGKGLTPTPGELSVSLGLPGSTPRLLAPGAGPLLTDADWENYAELSQARHRDQDRTTRRRVGRTAVEAWNRRHAEVRTWLLAQEPTVSSENPIDRYLSASLAREKTPASPRIGDLEFLRRLSLDTTGRVPTIEEIRRFLSEPAAQRRTRAIDRALQTEGWADHWVSYWQDVLAENPSILKPDLNNTGPFRWWLHQSLEDNLPFDRIAAEMVLMEGSALQGGPSGFGQATLSDSPMAAKSHILSQAFLGENLGCARCHDAPSHPFLQKDLFGLASMLSGKKEVIPATSTVPFREGARRPLVKVTSKAGEAIPAAWCFKRFAEDTRFPLPELASTEKSTPADRKRLATLLVAPENRRFAEVLVNRLWKRLMGRGFVEPVDDWSLSKPVHPELLTSLANRFVADGYDLKAFARLCFTSDLYQRRPISDATGQSVPTFAGPYRRRLSAEQIVDSLFLAVGKKFDTEDLNLNPLGDRPLSQFLNLGAPCRSWEFAALSNERDRPALALPESQGMVDILSTFGWRPSRQNPASTRDEGASPMQTLILANGNVGARLVRLSDDGAFVDLALKQQPVSALCRELFLRVLSRPPSAAEAKAVAGYLTPLYAQRAAPGALRSVSKRKTDSRVSWSNHLSAEASVIRLEEERRLRLGDEPTRRLRPAFRERMEDVVWALVNSPEFPLVP